MLVSTPALPVKPTGLARVAARPMPEPHSLWRGNERERADRVDALARRIIGTRPRAFS
jgi:hypothetical protein